MVNPYNAEICLYKQRIVMNLKIIDGPRAARDKMSHWMWKGVSATL